MATIGVNVMNNPIPKYDARKPTKKILRYRGILYRRDTYIELISKTHSLLQNGVTGRC